MSYMPMPGTHKLEDIISELSSAVRVVPWTQLLPELSLTRDQE